MGKKKPPPCPKCGSENVAPIVYGMPAYELFKKSEKGEVYLGGCCVTDNDPKWHCNSCEHEWGLSEASKRL